MTTADGSDAILSPFASAVSANRGIASCAMMSAIPPLATIATERAGDCRGKVTVVGALEFGFGNDPEGFVSNIRAVVAPVRAPDLA
jgi:hypothetical protein